jgi:hypothetical protein
MWRQARARYEFSYARVAAIEQVNGQIGVDDWAVRPVLR